MGKKEKKQKIIKLRRKKECKMEVWEKNGTPKGKLRRKKEWQKRSSGALRNNLKY